MPVHIPRGARVAAIILLCFLPLIPSPSAAAPPAIALEPVAGGFVKPTVIAVANDGSGRLFVAEKPGTIWIVRAGERVREPFLAIEQLVRARGNEQGLLGLAFHPAFTENGLFFICYTNDEGDVTVARYVIDPADPNRADPESAVVLLRVPKDYEDHNAGQLAFGPDGYLYIGVGDGGGKAEPERNAQRRSVLLGKVLRIDVDRAEGGKPYAIPPDNPFVHDEHGAPEIWAYGLRNPWRFSFDRAGGDLYLADVGLWSSEEIDVEPAGDPGGRNYGWNIVEGFECHDQERADRCTSTKLTPPVWVYHHDHGCAIVGGFVYRGSALPALSGVYLFADYCLGTIWGMTNRAGIHSADVLLDTELNINSFGQDEAGELYVAAMDGTIYRIVAG